MRARSNAREASNWPDGNRRHRKSFQWLLARRTDNQREKPSSAAPTPKIPRVVGSGTGAIVTEDGLIQPSTVPSQPFMGMPVISPAARNPLEPQEARLNASKSSALSVNPACLVVVMSNVTESPSVKVLPLLVLNARSTSNFPTPSALNLLSPLETEGTPKAPVPLT